MKETESLKDKQRQLLGLQEQTEDILNELKEKLQEAKGRGIILSELEELFVKAKNDCDNSQFQSAHDKGIQGLDKYKEIEETYYQAKVSLQESQNLIYDSKSLVDTNDAEKLYNKSKEYMNSGSYSEVIKSSKMIKTNIEQIKTNNKPILSLTSPENPTFKQGTWARWQLEIENQGKVHAKDIEFEITDEIESRSSIILPILKAGEKQNIEIGLRLQEIGEIPINIKTQYVNPILTEKQQIVNMLWINIEASDQKSDLTIESQAYELRKKTDEGIVKVLSELEVYQGFVRLKVGLKNEMNTVITDAKLDLEFDDNAMRLDRIEPELERKGHKIIFGNIHPQEKRTVAFYLDPLICTESHIDGTVTYKDIYGDLKTAVMKRRKAEVVCPIMYTPENINTAMLNRMIIEELTVHDSKIYEIPSGLDYKSAMKTCKDTIQAHDLKFVREFEEYEDDDSEIESWYYGETKVKKNKVIIKASSRKKTNTVELFVACENKKVITGFLAELGHNFNNKLKELGVINQPIFPITDSMTREKITRSKSLLEHQYTDKNILSLSKRGDEYEVSFKLSEGKGEAAELCDFIKVSPDSRSDLINQINDIVTVLNIFCCTRGGGNNVESQVAIPPKINSYENMDDMVSSKIQDLSSLGKLIYGMFLPPSIQKYMETINEPVILKTNDNEIPWELLHDEKDFLCLKVPVGRRLRSREIPRVNSVVDNDKVKILFIANATGDLEGAEKEVEYIIEHLDPDIEVDLLKHQEATTATVLSAFRSGKYDIIHFAGHAEFNIDKPDESALLCANKKKIFAQEIKRLLGGKPFVFLNACGSGQEKMCEDGESYTGSDTEGLASSFILGGALAFVGASWPIPDISAG
ncbi:MAG: CHAT domain-containing protein, partial [Candidatus Thorarchaeota archaeon]